MDDLQKHLVGIINVIIGRVSRGEAPENWSFLHPDIKFMEGYKNGRIQGRQNVGELIKQMTEWGGRTGYSYF